MRRGRRSPGLGAILSAYGFYLLAGMTRRADAMEAGRRNASRLRRLECRLAIDVELALQRRFLAHPRAVVMCNVLYLSNQVVVSPFSHAVLWRRRPERYVALKSSSVIVITTSAIWQTLHPVAPPRMADAEMIDTVSERTPLNLDSRVTRSLYNPVAAMPSLHAAASALTAWALWQSSTSPLGRTVAATYPGVIAVVVIVTGNHFVLDIAGGLALAVAVAALVSHMSATSGEAR